MEYKFETIKSHIESSINKTAEDGWRVVGFSEVVIFGSGVRWEVIYKRDSNWRETRERYEYKRVGGRNHILSTIEEYERRGWRFVSFSNSTTLGSSTSFDLIFERTY